MNDTSRDRLPPYNQTAGGNYTQVNIMFPSEQVELPDAEKFKAFPQEAQKAILEAFTREQTERHKWLSNQQTNEHAFNMQSGRHYFYWKMGGLIGGVLLSLSVLTIGGWLIKNGASAAGISMMLAAIAALVGTVVYGHHARQQPKSSNEAASPSKAIQKSSSDSSQTV